MYTCLECPRGRMAVYRERKKGEVRVHENNNNNNNKKKTGKICIGVALIIYYVPRHCVIIREIFPIKRDHLK